MSPKPATQFVGNQPIRPTPSTSPKISALNKALNSTGNAVSNADIFAPHKAWQKATGNPLGSALAAAAVAGTGAYFMAPWAAKKLRGLQGKLPAGAQHDVSDEEVATMRKRMTMLAALGVGGMSLATHFDPKYPAASLAKWDYVPKEAALEKEASPFLSDAVMQQDLIPLDHAKEIIANDRFLTSGQKASIGSIFDKTPDQSGNASMADVTSGAVRAGFGFAGGAIAGYALSKIFGLPASVTRTASITGGLANALRTSGLIS